MEKIEKVKGDGRVGLDGGCSFKKGGPHWLY